MKERKKDFIEYMSDVKVIERFQGKGRVNRPDEYLGHNLRGELVLDERSVQSKRWPPRLHFPFVFSSSFSSKSASLMLFVPSALNLLLKSSRMISRRLVDSIM